MRKTLAGDEYSALTHEHGPYSITRPNHSIARLVELLRAEVLEEALRRLPAARDANGEANDFAQGWRAGVLDCDTAIRAAKEGS